MVKHKSPITYTQWEAIWQTERCARSRLWPLMLSLTLHLWSVEHVCSVLKQPALPCDNLFGGLPLSHSHRNKRLEVHQQLQWTTLTFVGGEKPDFLAGRRYKCLKFICNWIEKWKSQYFMWSELGEMLIISPEILLLDLTLNVIVILNRKCMAVKGQYKYFL